MRVEVISTFLSVALAADGTGFTKYTDYSGWNCNSDQLHSYVNGCSDYDDCVSKGSQACDLDPLCESFSVPNGGSPGPRYLISQHCLDVPTSDSDWDFFKKNDQGVDCTGYWIRNKETFKAVATNSEVISSATCLNNGVEAGCLGDQPSLGWEYHQGGANVGALKLVIEKPAKIQVTYTRETEWEPGCPVELLKNDVVVGTVPTADGDNLKSRTTTTVEVAKDDILLLYEGRDGTACGVHIYSIDICPLAVAVCGTPPAETIFALGKAADTECGESDCSDCFIPACESGEFLVADQSTCVDTSCPTGEYESSTGICSACTKQEMCYENDSTKPCVSDTEDGVKDKLWCKTPSYSYDFINDDGKPQHIGTTVREMLRENESLKVDIDELKSENTRLKAEIDGCAKSEDIAEQCLLQ